MLSYPINLIPDDNGTVLVTCPDLPEVTTFGETEPEALAMARGAVAEALAARLKRFDPVPAPTKGSPRAEVGLQMTFKVQLYWALRDSDLSRADLARSLGWARPQVDRLFDANHATRLDQYERAFAALHRVPNLSLDAA
jgi:antitoxin HicB